ncbi:imidazolonepropionase [Prevotella sp. BV3P1]|uniref:imidazolonepropionase n=1 Tax=Prevotellaceae TaxID=171552 RepID=UPI0003B8C43C|nr:MULTISPECIES: imidazolonepropionase [Prevotellaceae]ERT58055.1 imidazolonepropionase [Prevotella sp. BV3P1]KGF40333.1 imidazolonepropionase [Hoylesella buccalis DNF00985]
MKLLVTNIAFLAGIQPTDKLRLEGKEMARLETIANAFLYVVDGRIHSYGAMSDLAKCSLPSDVQQIDAKGGSVLPSWCDSHTHIVFAGSREQEFVDKIRGLSYAEIAKRGGGILNSADKLHDMSEDELYQHAMRRVDEVIRKGTGCIEIKSGYGLNTADELKMLRVIKRIKETTSLKVVATFLGAHAVSREYAGRQSEYVNLVIREMIPAVAKENLAEYIDVFCDTGFFTPEETARILEAGAKYGMRGKIHADELASSGGVEVGVRHNALSVDHLESMTAETIETLRGSETMPTALPGTSFFLNMPFALGRKVIDEGLPLAVASDYNPGSTPSGDMKFVISLACIKMRLLPAEAINAGTMNSAYAMGLSKDYGSITKGKVANFYITKPIPSVDFIPYAYTTPIVDRIFLRGEEYIPQTEL